MACHVHIHEISERRHNNLLVCPINDSQSWSRMSTRITEEYFLKKLLLLRPETATRRKQRRKKQEVGDDLGVCVLNLFPEVCSPAKFRSHKSCACGDIILSFCHVTSMRSCDFSRWSFSRQVFSKWRYNILNLSRDLTIPCD